MQFAIICFPQFILNLSTKAESNYDSSQKTTEFRNQNTTLKYIINRTEYNVEIIALFINYCTIINKGVLFINKGVHSFQLLQTSFGSVIDPKMRCAVLA